VLSWILSAASGMDIFPGLLSVTAVVALLGAVGGGGHPGGIRDRQTAAPG
jgi:hypothetical protein